MARDRVEDRKCIALLFLALSLLAGCGLRGPKPTPLSWLPTQTPPPTAAAQAPPTTMPVLTHTTTPTTTQPGPTQTPVPPTPTQQPTQATPIQNLTLELPTAGATVSNPIRIQGRANIMPFEGTLVIRAYDAQGDLVVEEPIIATGDIGGPASFDVEIDVGAYTGSGRIEILDLSARDGSEIARATVSVTIVGDSGIGHIELPTAQATVTLPIRLLARVGAPQQPVTVSVSWDDGTRLNQALTTLTGLDDRGFLMAPVDFAESQQPHPPTQPATIEIRARDNVLLAAQRVRILAPDDPETMRTQVYWIRNETVVPQQIWIPRTLGIGRASLEALLWGPAPNHPEGYETLIPTPQDILTYPGRGPDWGERVTVQHLRIEDGVAYVDFSPELQSHAGGALATTLIREQITSTLTQFATVDRVTISINGMTGVLEP